MDTAVMRYILRNASQIEIDSQLRKAEIYTSLDGFDPDLLNLGHGTP